MSEPTFRILLIEDNPGDVRFIDELLQELESHSCEVKAVSRLGEGIEAARRDAPDIILLDLSLPDSIGLDTFYTLYEVHSQIPIIILTGLKDEDAALQAIRRGAQDYLVKGKFDEVLLYRAIRYAIERKNIEAALRDSEEKYRLSQAHLQNLAARLQDVREDERKRIAREVHDELGQLLTAIRLQIILLEQDREEDRVHDRIKDLYSVIDQAIDSVKRIASELRPVILDVLGLPAAIEWQAGEFQRSTGVELSLSMSDKIQDFTGDVVTAVFRIYQEVLTNIARHAGASAVSVVLSYNDGNIELEVSDDGVGIESSAISSSKSLGLLGMKERARQFNGAIEIEKKHTGGTTVSLQVPWGAEGADEDHSS